MSDTNSYSQILRAIGQDLEERDLNVFELEMKDSENLIQVRSQVRSDGDPAEDDSKEFRLSGFLKTLRKQEPGRESNGATPRTGSGVEIRYGSEEIDRLEQRGQLKRGSSSGSPEMSSLSQILRAVGAYIDQRGGRLVAVARRDRVSGMPSMTLRYASYQGELKEEDHLFSDIYDLNVRFYKKRKKAEAEVL